MGCRRSPETARCLSIWPMRWGGGAENYLQGRIADDLADTGLPAVVLRVGGAQARWQLELYSGGGPDPETGERRPPDMTAGHSDDFDVIETVLRPPDPAPHRLFLRGGGILTRRVCPNICWPLRGAGDPVEVLVHDFFMLSPSYTLLNDDGVYVGPVPADAPDRVHGVMRPDGTRLSLGAWRAAWAPLMAAGEIVAFSEDSAMHVRAAFPDLAGRIRVDPHDLLGEVPHILPLPRRADQPGRVLGVLGNIGYQKGAAVVADLGPPHCHRPGPEGSAGPGAGGQCGPGLHAARFGAGAWRLHAGGAVRSGGALRDHRLADPLDLAPRRFPIPPMKRSPPACRCMPLASAPRARRWQPRAPAM